MKLVPTDPPVARCLSCRRRFLSSDLCPICQADCVDGCGHSGDCLRLAREERLRVELEEGAAESPWSGVGKDAEVEP